MKLDEALKHLHAHTRLEAKLGVDSNHVIIDKEVFFALVEAAKNPLSMLNSPGLYCQAVGRAGRLISVTDSYSGETVEVDKKGFVKGFEEAVVVVNARDTITTVTVILQSIGIPS